MGKTKTVFVTGEATEEKSGKAAYEEKKRKQLEAQKKTEAEKTKVQGLGLKGGERIKVVGGELPPVEKETIENAEGVEKKKAKKIKVRSAKYKKAKTKIDRNKLYSLDDAIKLVKESSYSKFDGTMEMHLVVKKENLSVNINLPYQTGKVKKVEIADEKTIEKLKNGKVDFDVLLATAEIMPKLVPFAKLLGPKGLMPNPKNGTLIKNAKEAEKFTGNSLVIKTEKSQPVVHTVIGKVSQKDEELIANAKEIIGAITTKTISKAYLKSTMSPSVKFNIS